jgi:ribosomal protein S18 acetylase RimI-like enzyme
MKQVPWTDAEKQAFLEFQFEAQQNDYLRRFPHAEHSIVIFEGDSVGRIWIDRQEGEIRLLDVTILPDHQNQGIGTILLKELQQESASGGKPLRHSVYKTNTKALRFYHRLGFEVVEDFEAYVLMEWTKRG